MATINITGGTPPEGSSPPVQSGDPGTSQGNAVNDPAFQTQIKNMRYLMSMRESSSAREMAAIRAQNAEMEKGERARASLEQKQQRDAEVGARKLAQEQREQQVSQQRALNESQAKREREEKYLLGVRKTSFAWEDAARGKAAKEAQAQQRTQEAARQRAQQVSEREAATQQRADQAAQDRAEQQVVRKKEKDEKYLFGVRKTSLAWEDADRTKAQGKTATAQKQQQRDADRAARDTQRQKDKDEKYLRGVRQTSLNWEENAKKKAVADADRTERAAASAKRQRMNHYANAGRTGAMILNSVHGDFEGAATGLGFIGGAILGGPVGAEIGALAGEIVGKLTEAVIALPLAPGKLYDQYMSVSAPYLAADKSASDIAGAGGFATNDLMDRLKPAGSYNPAPWMEAVGATQAGVYKAINDTGIAPQSAAGAERMGQDIYSYRQTTGFRGLGDGRIESVLGQGISNGTTTPGQAGSYLDKFGNTLSKALPLDIDRSKVLTKIQEAVEATAKSGAGAVSTSGIMDSFQAFMMAGGPGRDGEGAARNLSSVQQVLGNLGGSPATMLGFNMVAQKFHGLKTDDDIKGAIGDDAFAQLQATPAGRQKLAVLKQATNGNNQFLAARYGQDVLGTDPARYQQNLLAAIREKNPGISDAQAYSLAAGMGGGTPGDVLTGDVGRREVSAANAKGDAGGRIYQASSEDQALHQKIKMGTATDAETAALMKKIGVPDKMIPAIMRQSKANDWDPIALSLVGRYENPHDDETRIFNKNGSSDTGYLRINSSHENEVGYNKEDPNDPNSQAYMAGKVLYGGKKGGLPNPGAYNPGTSQTAIDEKDGVGRAFASMGITNMPVQNSLVAKTDAAHIEGAKTEFELLAPAMRKVTEMTDATTTALHHFTQALDTATAKFNGTPGAANMPPPSNDVAGRLGTALVNGDPFWRRIMGSSP